MNRTLDRTLFLLAHCRLLVLELQELKGRLERLAVAAPSPERTLMEQGLEALEPVAVAGRTALVEIEEIVPAIEAERERGKDAP